MAEYLDSFLAELDTRSVVERNMLQNAKCTFEEGNILCMQLIDTVIAQGKKDSLTDYLKGVYAERFGLPIEIRVMYKEPKESTLKYNDMRLQQEVDSILDQGEAVQKQKEEKKHEKEAKTKRKDMCARPCAGDGTDLGTAGCRYDGSGGGWRCKKSYAEI